MAKIQVGDRIRCYWDAKTRLIGTVRNCCGDIVIFELDQKGGWLKAHIKQCRKLRRKERLENPRMFRMNTLGDDGVEYESVFKEIVRIPVNGE